MPDEVVTLNVGGKLFQTNISTLQKYSDTTLGKLYSRDSMMQRKDVEFFDRNPKVFSAILDFYRTGLLIKPTGIHETLWKNELDFWCLPGEESSEEQDRVVELLQKILEYLESGELRGPEGQEGKEGKCGIPGPVGLMGLQGPPGPPSSSGPFSTSYSPCTSNLPCPPRFY